MAAPAPLAYVPLDNFDRNMFDHVLSDNVERVAFINYFDHVNSNVKRHKRPRTGRGRVKLWNSRCRYWIARAAEQNRIGRLPQVQHPVGGGAPPPPPPPPAPVVAIQPPVIVANIPPAPVAQPLPPPALPVQDSVPLANIPAPPAAQVHTPAQNSDVAIGVVSAQADEQDLSRSPTFDSEDDSNARSSKRKRDDAEEEHLPAKRTLVSIGGDRSPQFILNNDPTNAFYLPPTTGQRHHVQSVLGGDWRFAKHLHQSDMHRKGPGKQWGIPPRSSSLFVKLDETGAIIDRAGVKAIDTSFEDPRSTQTTRREVEIEKQMSLVLPSTECPHIIAQRGTSERTTNFSIEYARPNDSDPSRWEQQYVFTEYAPHGTLNELIARHSILKTPIPEHYIWYTFKNLVDALITLRDGICPEHQEQNALEEPREDWLPILHLDIKPDNVFLGGADSKYPSYKRPLLADFDIAVRSEPNPKKREQQYDRARGHGLSGWQAPEHAHDYVGDPKYEPAKWPLTEQTDIYSVGILIRRMMLCSSKDASELDRIQKFEAENFKKRRDPVPLMELAPPDLYSVGLVNAVNGCLKFLPIPDARQPGRLARRTLKELRARIEQNLNRLDDLLGDQVTAPDHPRTHALHVDFPPADQRFDLGKTFKPDTERTGLKIGLSNTEDEKAAARMAYSGLVESWDDHSCTTAEAQEKVLDTVYEHAYREFQVAGKDPKRDIHIMALQHARSTILKLINPHGRFHQLQGNKDPDFFSPDEKHLILESMERHALSVQEDTMDEELEKASSVLCHAVRYGMRLLEMGDEPEDQRMDSPSETHIGVWEYFISQPEGVKRKA